MAKSLEPQIVNPIITGFIEELLTTKGGLTANKPFEIAAKPIEEYEERMRVHATDKFDVAVYIAVANFSGSLQITQNFTNDPDRLRAVIKGVKFSSVNTADSGPSLNAASSRGIVQ